MPIVQPDYRGTTHTVTLALESELLLRTLAYSKMCGATLDSVTKVALTRLLEADGAELDAWLAQHKEELEPKNLRGFPTGARRRRGASARSHHGKPPSGTPTATPAKPTPVAAVGAKG
jgi:hypothetical protein